MQFIKLGKWCNVHDGLAVFFFLRILQFFYTVFIFLAKNELNYCYFFPELEGERETIMQFFELEKCYVHDGLQDLVKRSGSWFRGALLIPELANRKAVSLG